MKPLLLLLLTIVATAAGTVSASAMSRERRVPMLRTGDYYVDFANPEIVNVSPSYAYSMLRKVQEIVTQRDMGDSADEYSSTREPAQLGTLIASCRIERIDNSVKLSVSLVNRANGELYFASELLTYPRS